MELTYQALINNSFIEHTKLTLKNEEKLTYFIDKTSGIVNLERYPIVQYGIVKSDDIIINNNGHNDFYYKFIKSSLAQLDKIIDLDFEEMTTTYGSMIDIYNVSSSSSFNDFVIGEAYPQRSAEGSWWDILWKDSNFVAGVDSTANRNTIIHEIGHALGLKHPFDDPTNKLWSSENTVMSYNPGPNGWDYWFSETDLDALINIWGRENDQNYINFKKNSFEYKYKRTPNKEYLINTNSGEEVITNIKTLKFIDKEIDVANEIISVFELVKGNDYITGKIYRLYNAAFGRFPDRDGLEYWINSNTSGKDSYRATAKSFIVSDEFINLYGRQQSNENYIHSLYRNILNRSADNEGFNYWLNQINSGIEDKSELLMGFAESQENKLIFSNETSIF